METVDPVVALVVAVAENGVIGRGGEMAWWIPSELRHFRRLTMGKPVVMGRRTFASLKKPLDGRDNIVITRNRDFAPKGAIAVESVEQALKVAADCALARASNEIMVIGGAEIYTQLMPHAKRIYLTRVHAEPEGDIRFPDFDAGNWREVESVYHPREADDQHDYTLLRLERNSDGLRRI